VHFLGSTVSESNKIDYFFNIKGIRNMPITRKMIDDELVPLLKTINEQVTVEDVYGIDFYHTDGRARGSICKIILGKSMVYLWANGETYSNGIDEAIMNPLKTWISSKVSLPE